MEMPVSFLSMPPCVSLVCRIQLLLSVDRYRYSGVRISIGGDKQTDISYSPILQCHEYLPTDIRHQSNTNCPFVIVLKMHCGYLMCVLKLEILILDCCRYSIDSGYWIAVTDGMVCVCMLVTTGSPVKNVIRGQF